MQILKSGVFSVRYENGFIRHIRYGDLEVIRMIYLSLRDQNWTTYEPLIENEIIEHQENGFEIKYDCFHELRGERIFKWQVIISGSTDGVITFELYGEALADVLKNRAGICVLHPIKSTAGQPCETFHTNGGQIKRNFPVIISADNPFKDIQGLRWRCHYDWFVLHFEGDGFETEDQRNWSDASYKTFCTPLSKPFPVLLKAGEKIHQKVIFNADSELLPLAPADSHVIEIIALAKKSTLPSIGIAASTETDSLCEENLRALVELQLSHYRIDVDVSTPNWIEKFHVDCGHAEHLLLPLEVALHLSEPNHLKDFFQTYNALKPVIQRLILLSADRLATDQALIDKVDSFRKLFPAIEFGAGTDYNFRELNCNRFNPEPLDFISYSIDPQEHATDNLTIIENIGALADTVLSAKDLYESKSIHISSLTLKKRFNASASNSKDRVLSNERKTDFRLQTNFGAAFTLGSVKSLSLAEVKSMTLFQTVGDQGIISASGKKFPVYDVLKEILTANKSHVIHTVSSQPLLCDALLLNSDQSFKMILVNYSTDIQRVLFIKDVYVLDPLEIRIVNIG